MPTLAMPDTTDSKSPRCAEELEQKILSLVAELHRVRLEQQRQFEPGSTPVPYGGRVYDEQDMQAIVKAGLDFWLTLGPEGNAFESELAAFLGVKHALLVNSGSSANLLAFAALMSPTLERPICCGDEVITVAAAFPTTVNPIIQCGCVPVFVDIDERTANVSVAQLERALSPRTRAVMLAHTLGNPFDLEAVSAFCQDHDLFLVEDNCDSLGSTYGGRLTGTFGHVATSSFYPPHHITMGEGGALYTDNTAIWTAAQSLRDWGRDCTCASGQDNRCGHRYTRDWREEWRNSGGHPSSVCLPVGYDHKYVYSHIGYNLRPTDLQAAIGRTQLRKLPAFIEARKRNWSTLRDGLSEIENEWQFMEATPSSDPSWFGFLAIMKNPDHERLNKVCMTLDANRIGHRRLFAGNLIWQPAYRNTRYRVVGDLQNSERAALGGLFLGVYPGLTDEMLDAQIRFFKEAVCL